MWAQRLLKHLTPVSPEEKIPQNEDASEEPLLHRMFETLTEYVEGPLAKLGWHYYGAEEDATPREAGLLVWEQLVKRSEYPFYVEAYEGLRDLYLWWNDLRPQRFDDPLWHTMPDAVRKSWEDEDVQKMHKLIQYRSFVVIE